MEYKVLTHAQTNCQENECFNLHSASQTKLHIYPTSHWPLASSLQTEASPAVHPTRDSARPVRGVDFFDLHGYAETAGDDFFDLIRRLGDCLLAKPADRRRVGPGQDCLGGRLTD